MKYTSSERAAITRALNIIAEKGPDMDRFSFTSPGKSAEYLRLEFERLADHDREHFIVVFLDTMNRIVDSKLLFSGTINGAAVYPRVVAREALILNVASVILAHNHPSGNATPSAADRRITKAIDDALGLFDMRVIDHIILTQSTSYYSFAENGDI